MPTAGSLTRAAALAACFLATIANPVQAQLLPTPSTAPPSPDVMTHYNFQLSMASLSGDDRRFAWDSHFGGDIDLVDYVAGRANILIDYEAVLGNEYRSFDPNQGNYTLEASLSLRAAGTEFAGVFHHVSRHISDRPKRFPIAWNEFGGRVLRRLAVAGNTIDAQAGVTGIVRHAFVDYSWHGNVDLVFRRSFNRRFGFFAHGFSEWYGVHPEFDDRTSQTGGRVEAGLRLSGRGGATEFFAGYEKRLDADPLDRQSQHWALLGFRFVGP